MYGSCHNSWDVSFNFPADSKLCPCWQDACTQAAATAESRSSWEDNIALSVFVFVAAWGWQHHRVCVCVCVAREDSHSVSICSGLGKTASPSQCFYLQWPYVDKRQDPNNFSDTGMRCCARLVYSWVQATVVCEWSVLRVPSWLLPIVSLPIVFVTSSCARCSVEVWKSCKSVNKL